MKLQSLPSASMENQGERPPQFPYNLHSCDSCIVFVVPSVNWARSRVAMQNSSNKAPTLAHCTSLCQLERSLDSWFLGQASTQMKATKVMKAGVNCFAGSVIIKWLRVWSGTDLVSCSWYVRVVLVPRSCSALSGGQRLSTKSEQQL